MQFCLVKFVIFHIINRAIVVKKLKMISCTIVSLHFLPFEGCAISVMDDRQVDEVFDSL
jgi:hypothetical protein